MSTPGGRRWRDALALWEEHQRHRQLSPGTIAKRLEQMRRFATAEADPWAVRYEDIVHWLRLKREAGWAEGTERVHRAAITAFYLWAFNHGHTPPNPAAFTSRRAAYQRPPESWVQPIENYRRYLRGVGRTESTVDTRVNALLRFARENPSLAPEQVRFDDLVSWLGGKRWAPETRNEAPWV